MDKFKKGVPPMPTPKEVREPKFNPQSIDAKEWVNEFNRIEVSNGLQPTDPEKMLGWFANAIMAGYYEATRSFGKKLPEPPEMMDEEEIERILNELGNNCYEEGQGRLKTTIADEIDKAKHALTHRIPRLEGKPDIIKNTLCSNCQLAKDRECIIFYRTECRKYQPLPQAEEIEEIRIEGNMVFMAKIKNAEQTQYWQEIDNEKIFFARKINELIHHINKES
jgi:hypothetical protein